MEHADLSKRKKLSSPTMIAGLALFSMLFGAGNLILPIRSGIIAGDNQLIGFLGFMLSGVGFPLLGLWAMVLFDGDYQRFFYRLGKPLGSFVIGLCLLVLGPIISIPRITTLLYSLVTRHLPFAPPAIFVTQPLTFTLLLFAFIFLLSYRERSIIRILTRFINPPFIALLLFVIIVGYLQTPLSLVPLPAPATATFNATLSLGYQTLDLLAMLFLYSFMFGLLKEQTHAENEFKKRSLSYTGLKAGFVGLSVLTLVYIGLIHLGSNYSPLSSISHGKLFDAVSYQLFGTYGSLITGLVSFLACISTAMALAALVAEWLQHSVFDNAIGYKGSLLIVLGLSIPFSTSILDTILKITSGPLITIGYPVLVTITVCNILYKTVGFKPIKTPTAIAFIVATAVYLITNKPF